MPTIVKSPEPKSAREPTSRRRNVAQKSWDRLFARREAHGDRRESMETGGRTGNPLRFDGPESIAAGSDLSSAISLTGAASSFDALPKALERARESLYKAAKRCLDIVIVAIAIALLSPVMLATAALIKLTDRGPILFAHTRVGFKGREFKCFKFRSMVVDAESIKAKLATLNAHDDSRTFKMRDDPRVTTIGRWIRKLSIDELPQLWNVLRGDMSIVGPRPPVPAEVNNYSPSDMRRLSVKPGLTCIWQVSGRSHVAFPEQLRMDLQYIANRSLLLDLKLMARTIPAVLSADGAY